MEVAQKLISQQADHLLGANAAVVPHSARRAHAEFLQRVRDIADLQTGGRELQELANNVFRILGEDGVNRAQITSLLSTTVSQEAFSQLQDSYEALSEEREKLALPTLRGQDSGRAEWVPQYFQPTGSAWPVRPEAVLPSMCMQLSGRPRPEVLMQPARANAEVQWAAHKEAAKTVPLSEPSEGTAHVMEGRERTASKMTLTALERLICSITGTEPPRKGGDQSVLLLVIGVLVQHEQPDAAAGHLLEVLGYDHMDDITHIVTMRKVRRKAA
jgi:hypothetical protein